MLPALPPSASVLRPVLHSLIQIVRRPALLVLAACATTWAACASGEGASRPEAPPLPEVPRDGSRPDLGTLPTSGTRTTDGVLRIRLPDTLRYDAAPGEAWIGALPAEAEGLAITYRPLSAPALSWVVDGALFAQTLASQRGALRFDLQRVVGGYTDTLVVVLDLAEDAAPDTTAALPADG